MAFIQFNLQNGHIPFEYRKAGALTLEIGTALTETDGLLAIATGTTAPTYISQYAGETKSGDLIPVTRVRKEQIYETELSVAGADIEAGAKYTIDATGGKITATETGGVAELVDFDGTTAGSRVLVRF